MGEKLKKIMLFKIQQQHVNFVTLVNKWHMTHDACLYCFIKYFFIKLDGSYFSKIIFLFDHGFLKIIYRI